MSSTLRAFSWSDVGPLTGIYRHYVEHTAVTFDLDTPSERVMAEKFGSIAEQDHPLIIAEQEGETVGYAYASTYRPRPAYRFTCENSVYLRPDMVGRGLGKLLLGRLIEDSRAFGFKQMIAVVTADTKASIAIHEKFGFRRVGHYEAVGFKFGRWHDIVHLQLAL